MSDTMTLAGMATAFDSEWVLVGDPELDQDLQVVRGRVLFHSKNRDEIDRKDEALGPAFAAIIYTGRIPDNAAVVL